MRSARAAFEHSGCGSKLGGVGPPLMAELMGKQRNFVDGGGFMLPESHLATGCFAALRSILNVHLEPRKLLFELACPFPEAKLSEAQVTLCEALTQHGARPDLNLRDVPARKMALVGLFGVDPKCVEESIPR